MNASSLITTSKSKKPIYERRVQTKNYQRIMLLGLQDPFHPSTVSVYTTILPIREGLDYEQQCGFRPDRGCL